MKNLKLNLTKLKNLDVEQTENVVGGWASHQHSCASQCLCTIK